ncbi:MAG TPA: ATP-dependent 6-phosphofructokinase [Acidobacteriota bacterium]|nr:ATP-dependent 6-phosphofructokinase [Acidobacteriota bacterium]
MRTKIAILTGGGDCAGLNPAIKWVTNTALDPFEEERRGGRYEVIGIREGWKGLVEYDPDTPGMDSPWIEELSEKKVRNWDRAGGTWLGSSRTNPFDPKQDQSERLRRNIEALGIDVIVAIGGEDTLGVAHRLHTLGVKVVGIPKTIDKDLGGTDYSLGFQTALEIITREIDMLRTTAGSHGRIFVVETMGRHAGWLALEGGIASGAYIILIPEFDFDADRVCELLVRRRNMGVRYSIVVIAEGAKASVMDEAVSQSDIGIDSFGHKTLGGIGNWLRARIVEKTGFDIRAVTLSHLQRGGLPCAYDRLMGRNFGVAAVDLIEQGLFGQMVSYKQGAITSVPLTDAVDKLHVVDVDEYYDKERYNGRRKGILTTSSPGVVVEEEQQ